MKDRLRGAAYGLSWAAWNALIFVGRLLWPLIALGFWLYRRLFPDRFEAQLMRGQARGRAFQEMVERQDPALFETATGRKARPASELRRRIDRSGKVAGLESGYMIDSADVVVIGSGGLGAATAFYLVLHGARDVVVVDKHEIASQTSPRAAGLMSHARTSDLMVQLVTQASRNLKRFSDDTGQPLDWTQSGSLKVARRPQDIDVIESDVARGRRLGLDVERIPPDEAHRLNPFLQTEGVLAVMRVGDDLYFDPSQVAIGFARGAEARGATLLPHTTVMRVHIEDGEVAGVETDRGTIRTRVVVDAAGAWTRQVAEASGIRIPILPTRHQLFVTEPLEGATPDLPIVRVIDAAVYVRPCDGGLLWGGFEEDPRTFDVDALGTGFQIRDTPLDAEVLRRLGEQVKEQLPILLEAPVREHRGGIPTMTGDGEHIVGPAPGARGFFVAGGCNVAGLSVSPAIGEALAAWIVDGEPPIDLAPLSITRFAEPYPEEQLEQDAAWQYRHFYGAV